MVLDVSISALLALLTIGMAYLGVHVTLHPPNESPRARSWYKRGFFACGALAVLLVIVQGVRTNKAQRSSAAQTANLGKDVEGARAEAQAAKMEASNARTEVENESARRQQAEKDLLIALQSTGKATRQGIAEDIRKAPLQVEVNGQPIRDEGKNRQIREALGAFIRQGLDLKARCSTDDPKSSLEEEAQKWFEAVQGYSLCSVWGCS